MRSFNDEAHDIIYVEYDENPKVVRYEIDYKEADFNSVIKQTKYINLDSAFESLDDDSSWVHWAHIVHKNDCAYHSTKELLNHYESITSTELDFLFIKKIRSALEIYSRECGEDSVDMKLSAKSLMELIRYAPELSKKTDSKVYFDKNAGCFGLIYKQTKRKKGTLNIIIKPNNEILFSFVRKVTGVIRFTGRAYIGDSLDNSKGIKALFKMMEW